jgi:hypothetical protein
MPRHETPAWLAERHRQERPTEILLPVVEGIGPVWSHTTNSGGWYAFLACAVETEAMEVTSGIVAECDHGHLDEDSAWSCAADPRAPRDLAGDPAGVGVDGQRSGLVAPVPPP